MMIVAVCLLVICIMQFVYIFHMRKRLSNWLVDLTSVKNSLHQKIFTKDRGMLANINFVLNDILEENQKQLLHLKQSGNAQRQLLTNLSHDVRTPLASITGYLEACDSGSANDMQEYIHVACLKSLDLKILIDKLFEWFKLNSGEQDYQFGSYDINELTRELVIEWLPLFEKNQISFSVFASDEEWLLWIDPMAIKRILNNLLQNAVYHGKCSHITIRIKKTEHTVTITISNNGNTIPADKLPYLFDRLYQCNPVRSETGSGLGLAIAKELTHAMAGELSVASTPDEETAFSLLFPIYVREK